MRAFTDYSVQWSNNPRSKGLDLQLRTYCSTWHKSACSRMTMKTISNDPSLSEARGARVSVAKENDVFNGEHPSINIYGDRERNSISVSIVPPFERVCTSFHQRGSVKTVPFYPDDQQPDNGDAFAVGGASDVLSDHTQVEALLSGTFGFSGVRVKNAIALLGCNDVDQLVSFLLENEKQSSLDAPLSRHLVGNLRQVIAMGFCYSESFTALKASFNSVSVAVGKLVSGGSSSNPDSPSILESSRYNFRQRRAPSITSVYNLPQRKRHKTGSSAILPTPERQIGGFTASRKKMPDFPWNWVRKGFSLFLKTVDMPKQFFCSERSENGVFHALSGHTDELMELLRDENALAGPLDARGNNILHYSACQSSLEMIRRVVAKRSVLLCQPNVEGQYPLEFRAIHRSLLHPDGRLQDDEAFIYILSATKKQALTMPASGNDVILRLCARS